MHYRQTVPLLALAVVLMLIAHFSDAPVIAYGEGTPASTSASTAMVPPCAILPTGTAATATALLMTPAATASMQPTSLATQDANAPLRFNAFLPTDVKFNPDNQNPVALIMVFSVASQNETAADLDVKHPHFKLAIDDIPWGDIASTDFQQGRLPANGTLDIVLQSLTIVRKTNDAQKAVLECIKTGQPVDLELTGTISVYPGGNEQILSIRLLAKQVVIRPHQEN